MFINCEALKTHIEHCFASKPEKCFGQEINNLPNSWDYSTDKEGKFYLD